MSNKMSHENALTFVGTRLAMHTHSLKTSTDTLGLAESIRLNREACTALGEDCLMECSNPDAIDDHDLGSEPSECSRCEEYLDDMNGVYDSYDVADHDGDW